MAQRSVPNLASYPLWQDQGSPLDASYPILRSWHFYSRFLSFLIPRKPEWVGPQNGNEG